MNHFWLWLFIADSVGFVFGCLFVGWVHRKTFEHAEVLENMLDDLREELRRQKQITQMVKDPLTFGRSIPPMDFDYE
jgi:uncharacterized membrane-anchored protein YhcB (DUF1043 family)